MYAKKLYQTIRAYGQPKDLERQGPFVCTRRDAWLGEGCYYWETFIEHAHWWGHKSYAGSYYICKSELSIPRDRLYDLEDSDTLMEFDEIVRELEKVHPDKEITVPFVIQYLKKVVHFPYKAIKARFEGAKSKRSKAADGDYLYINMTYRSSCLDRKPHIQVCLLDKSTIGKGNYKIIYP